MMTDLRYALDTAHKQPDGTFYAIYDWTHLSQAANPQPTIERKVADCGYVLVAFGYNVEMASHYIIFRRKD